MTAIMIAPVENCLEPMSAPSLYPPCPLPLVRKPRAGEFSFFSKPVTNTQPSMIMNVLTAYQAIRSERYAPQTRVLRALSDKQMARGYKSRNFDYVCYSGVFTKRNEAGLVQHSGLLTIDFDHVMHLNRLKFGLIHDLNFTTVLAFTSPSGDGLKWIVKIDVERYTHLQWFLGLQTYIRATYHLEIDKSGKDVSRCCFLPYDPEVFINPDYLNLN